MDEDKQKPLRIFFRPDFLQDLAAISEPSCVSFGSVWKEEQGCFVCGVCVWGGLFCGHLGADGAAVPAALPSETLPECSSK